MGWSIGKAARAGGSSVVAAIPPLMRCGVEGKGPRPCGEDFHGPKLGYQGYSSPTHIEDVNIRNVETTNKQEVPGICPSYSINQTGDYFINDPC